MEFNKSDIGGVSEPFVLETREILLMCAVLTSSDTIAAVSIVKYEQQPKVYSIIFGEGIMNDAVGIIIF